MSNVLDDSVPRRLSFCAIPATKCEVSHSIIPGKLYLYAKNILIRGRITQAAIVAGHTSVNTNNLIIKSTGAHQSINPKTSTNLKENILTKKEHIGQISYR